MHTTRYCCSATDCDGSRFSLEDLLPGTFLPPPPPLDAVQKPKRINNAYRPTQQRPFLEFRLNEWLAATYIADPFRCSRPPDLILSDTQRATLIRTDPTKLESPGDITALLEESVEWGTEWAVRLFEVITQFDQEYALSVEKSTTHRKRKRN